MVWLSVSAFFAFGRQTRTSWSFVPTVPLLSPPSPPFKLVSSSPAIFPPTHFHITIHNFCRISAFHTTTQKSKQSNHSCRSCIPRSERLTIYRISAHIDSSNIQNTYQTLSQSCQTSTMGLLTTRKQLPPTLCTLTTTTADPVGVRASLLLKMPTVNSNTRLKGVRNKSLRTRNTAHT